jgi:hypothetical protein
MITIEALLLAGAGITLVEDWITAQEQIPAPARIIFVMVLTAGLLGSIVVIAEQLAKKGVSSTHKAIKKAPLPTPLFLIHGAALVGIYFLYGWVFGIPWW